MAKDKRRIPYRNENLEQDDLLNEVEQELKELRRKVNEGEQPPTLMRSMGVGSNDMGIPMNDSMLSEMVQPKVQEKSAFDLTVKELMTRIAEIEDNMPEFKGLNSWDVPIPLLPATATLPEVVSTINKLIQRTSRQDRVK